MPIRENEKFEHKIYTEDTEAEAAASYRLTWECQNDQN